MNFSSSGSSDPEGQPLTYSWTFGDGVTSTVANPSHTYTQSGRFTARLSVSDGTNTTLSTPIVVTVGTPPTVSILAPTDGNTFRAGDVISFSGDATDTEDGTLPASAYTWTIDFLHDGHVHPGIPLVGVKSGTFTIPITGHDFRGNTRFRFTLTVTDSSGLSTTKSVIIWPQKVNLTFNTVPAGLTLYVDGIASVTPFVYDTLIGFNHTVDARDQSSGTSSYTFSSWSDGGGSQHTIVAPSTDQSVHRDLQRRLDSGDAGLRPGGRLDPPDASEHGRNRLRPGPDRRKPERRRDRLEQRNLQHHLGHGQPRKPVPTRRADHPERRDQPGDLTMPRTSPLEPTPSPSA